MTSLSVGNILSFRRVLMTCTLIVLLGVTNRLLGQPHYADSLLRVLSHERNAEKRVDLLNGIAYFYFDYDDSLARIYARQALSEAERTEYRKGEKYSLMMVGLGTFSAGEFQDGLKYLRRAARIDSGGDLGMDSYNYLLIGRVYFELAEFDSALMFHQKAFDALQGKGSNNAIANVYRNIGQVLLTQWKNEEAFDYLKQAEALVISGDTRDYILAEIQTLLGVYYENMLDFEESEKYYNRVCELARLDNGLYHLIKCELRQADLDIRRGAFSDAFKHCSQALAYTDKYTYPPQLAEILHRLGEVYAELSQHELAIEYYSRSLKISEGLGLRYLTARIYADKAWVLHERHNDNEAFEYINRSLEIRSKIGDRKGIGNCHNVRGLIYFQLNRTNEALAELERAKQEWAAIGHTEGVASCNFNLALIYNKLNQKARAIQMMEATIKTEEMIGNKKNLGLSYNTLAEFYMEAGRLPEAERYLAMSMKMAEETRSLTQKRYNYKAYANLYERRGDFKRAYQSLLKHDAMVDSIYSETSTTKLAEMQALYQVEQKDQKIKLLDQEAQLRNSELSRQRSELETQRIATVASLVAITLISVLALTVHRSNRRVKKAHQEVVEKNEEIQAQAEELTESNQLLTRLHREVTEKNEEIEAQSEELKEANETIIEINKSLESKIETRTSDLKQAYKELDTFFYRSSHDFRRPLTTFMGLAEVAKITLKDENALGLFAKVNETAHNLDRMLVKLQSISDIGAQQLIFKEVFLQDVIEGILDVFRSELDAKGIHVQLNMNHKNSLVSYPALVRIVVENLVENAMVFSNPASPSIKIDVVDQTGGVELRIADNGEGISDAVKDRIFEMYFRGSERSRGNGLGLYIVKKAVEKLHGQISFESEVHLKTVFKVFLPSQLTS